VKKNCQPIDAATTAMLLSSRLVGIQSNAQCVSRRG
jgi:hypothetical protein